VSIVLTARSTVSRIIALMSRRAREMKSMFLPGLISFSPDPCVCVVGSEDGHRPDDLDAGGVDRHQDLGLLAVRICVRV